MIAAAESPYQICLTGHSRWIGVCHEEVGMCPRCLRAVARFLAHEIGYDTRSAMDWPTATYAEQIGITHEQGAELRRLTVLECFLHGTDFGGFARGATLQDLIVADEVVLLERAA